MNLFNWNSNCKQKHEFCHLKNLLLLANADNVIINEELQCITEVMMRESLTEEDAKRAINELQNEGLMESVNINLSKIKVIPPPTKEKRLVYLQDMVAVMLIDGNINNREKEFCEYVALKYGFKPSVIDIMIPFVLKEANNLSYRIENQNNSIMDDCLEIIANSEDAESAKENFVGYLAAKRNPQMALKQATDSITKAFEDALEDTIREIDINDPIMTDLVYRATIASCIESYKSSTTLHHISGLNKVEYEKLIDSIAIKVMNKYFE